MNALIALESKKDYIRLLHAFLACHDLYSHAKNIIEFDRGDGITLKIDASLGGITFGDKQVPWNMRLGAENVSSGFMEEALRYYISGDKGSKSEEKLVGMKWEWGKPIVR